VAAPRASVFPGGQAPDLGPEPLIYLAGIRVHPDNGNPDVLDGYDPADVASIRVLGGSAAVERYGERAADGVVSINPRATWDPNIPPAADGDGVVVWTDVSPELLSWIAERVPDGEPATFLALTGRVVSAETGEPVPSAQVFIESLALGVLSRLDGTYLLIRIPEDLVGTDVVVEARKIGFAPTQQTLTLGSDTNTLDLELGG
jgi:hypothetical protein